MTSTRPSRSLSIYRTRLASLVLPVLLAGALACGGGAADGATDGAQPKPRVALITPGSISDAAWNSGAYKGLEAIRDSLGAEVSHVEARTPAEQEEALRTYAVQGYTLVFAHGFEFQRAAERVSAEHPKTVFIVTSGEKAVGNVAPLIFRLHDATYLAGMVSGGLTKSNILAFVGGVEIPPVVRNMTIKTSLTAVAVLMVKGGLADNPKQLAADALALVQQPPAPQPPAPQAQPPQEVMNGPA